MSVEPSRTLQEHFGSERAKDKRLFSQPSSVAERFDRSRVSINVSPDRTLLEIAASLFHSAAGRAIAECE